jgi:DNA invertase Pin-like site-specific DNA recombinase
LRILAMNLDTASSASRLMLHLFALAVGARDHARRQREGIAKAKGEGEYTGRAPTARAKSRDVPSLGAEGMTREVIVAQLKTGVASVYRGLKAA